MGRLCVVVLWECEREGCVIKALAEALGGSARRKGMEQPAAAAEKENFSLRALHLKPLERPPQSTTISCETRLIDAPHSSTHTHARVQDLPHCVCVYKS